MIRAASPPCGHGVYATYWGYDARGNLAAALTDFGIVPWADPAP